MAAAVSGVGGSRSGAHNTTVRKDTGKFYLCTNCLCVLAEEVGNSVQEVLNIIIITEQF